MAGSFRFGLDATQPWEWIVPQKVKKDVKPPDIRSRTTSNLTKREIEITALGIVPTFYDPFIMKETVSNRFKRKTCVSKYGEGLRCSPLAVFESTISPIQSMPIEVQQLGQSKYFKTINTDTGQVHAYKTTKKSAQQQADFLNSIDPHSIKHKATDEQNIHGYTKIRRRRGGNDTNNPRDSTTSSQVSTCTYKTDTKNRKNILSKKKR